MKKTYDIQLVKIEDAKDFVDILSRKQGEFDLVSGKYTINARSILGIFSLDLSKPLQLKVSDATEELEKELQPYLKK